MPDTTTTPEGRPQDVPLDLHKLAVQAINANRELPDSERDMTPGHILAAVLPEHERQVREQVAAEQRCVPDHLTVYPANEILYGRCGTCGEVRWRTHYWPAGRRVEGAEHCGCCTHPHDLAPGGYDMPVARGEAR